MKIHKNLLNLFFVLILIGLSYWSIRPLLFPGFFPMHDDTQPARVYEMAKAISDGHFPVRIVPDLGYGFGYPLFNFYAPLPYYLGGFFCLLGFDTIVATKLMFAIGILLSAVSMYFLARELVGGIGALSCAVLYLYAPYHAVNIYVRGAVGELYVYGFLPLIVLGILKLFKNQKGIYLASIGFAGVLLSHNILGMISGLFLAIFLAIFLIYTFFRKKNFNHFKALLFVLIIGFGLSAFFTLPAFFEKKFTRAEELTTGGNDFRQHFVFLDQLWNSPWGYAGSAPGRMDGMSFKIGKIHLILGLISLLSLTFLYKSKKIDQLQHIAYILSLMLLVISLFFMLESSLRFWEFIPLFPYIQYPWRFLNFTLFAICLMAGFVFISLNKLWKTACSFIIISLTLWFNVKYFAPREYLPLSTQDYISDVSLRYKISKISDEYLPYELKVPKNSNEIIFKKDIEDNPDVIILNSQQKTTERIYWLKVLYPTKLVSNIAVFPGWKAFSNGKKIPTFTNQGRLAVDLLEGKQELVFRFVDTPIRQAANAISIFSLFLLVYVTLLRDRKIYGKTVSRNRHTHL